MYLSLKGSLGHTPITDRVGENLLQIAEGASAAYSLRNLGSDSPAVVRVRRESDNAERDFTAQDINTSALVNWVNQQITPPLDLRELTATGRDGPIIDAAAAYSLRNLSDSYTGNVVEVRRNTDGALKDFKASEVTDGTLEAWVNTSFANALPLDTASGAAAAYSLRNLSTGYTGNVVDVRRSSDDAEDSFTAAEVADGTMVAWVNTDVDKLDLQAGSLDAFITNETATGFDFSVNNVGSNKFKNLLSAADTTAGTYTATLDVVLNSGSLTGCNLFHESSGSAVVTPLTEGANSISLTPDANTSLFFYILGTAVADVSITNITLTQTSADGTVSQWYDQSGNDNHATQGTDASQPKIVDAGVLVSGGIDFDGVDDSFTLTSGLTIDPSTSGFSSFIATKFDKADTGSAQVLLRNNNSNPKHAISFNTSGTFRYNLNDGTNNIFADTGSDYGDNSLNLFSTTITGQSATGLTHFVNGSQDGQFDTSLMGDTGSTADTISWAAFPFGGVVQEIIFYETDQSAKRRAIEENIGSNYGITVTSSKDGTVSKWYDQSTTAGTPNANHAVQTDAASQPKIVDSGSLVTGGLDFDGVDDFLLIGDLGLSQPTSVAFVHNSDTNASGGNDLLDGTSVSTGRTLIDGTGSFYRIFAGASAATSKTLVANQDALVFTTLSNGSSEFSLDGSNETGLTAGTNGMAELTLGASISGGRYDGTFAEFIIYPSDQSDNRTALEANIGEVYSIAGIPAYDDTVNGFVETWYDQSGNDNDAVQETAGNQPKIVDAGVLVTNDEGNPAIQGATGKSFGLSAITGLEDVSIFFVGAVPSSFQAITGWGTNLHMIRFSSSDWEFEASTIDAGNMDWNSALTSGDTALFNFTRSSGTVTGYANSVASDTTSNANSNPFGLNRIFTRSTVNYNDYGGKASELIIYPSDQSANRAAIETNINNQYDI